MTKLCLLFLIVSGIGYSQTYVPIYEASGSGTVNINSTSATFGSVTIPAGDLSANNRIDVDFYATANSSNSYVSATQPHYVIDFGSSGSFPNAYDGDFDPEYGSSFAYSYLARNTWIVTGTSSEIGFASGVTPGGNTFFANDKTLITDGSENTSNSITIYFKFVANAATNSGSLKGYWTVKVWP